MEPYRSYPDPGLLPNGPQFRLPGNPAVASLHRRNHSRGFSSRRTEDGARFQGASGAPNPAAAPLIEILFDLSGLWNFSGSPGNRTRTPASHRGTRSRVQLLSCVFPSRPVGWVAETRFPSAFVPSFGVVQRRLRYLFHPVSQQDSMDDTGCFFHHCTRISVWPAPSVISDLPLGSP